ncbi:MAG: NTP transferase domain-containing protein [Tepidiformaceae bacterium]
MRAVVLAAGDGGRLEELTSDLPKPLVPLAGRPILDYTLDALASAGISDVIVVTGYREAQLREALTAAAPSTLTLSFVTNDRFHGGASLSLRAARAALDDEPFLLLMADHVLSPRIIRALLDAQAARPDASFVAADFSERGAKYSEEATKLLISDAIDGERRVAAIGKELPRWRALDAGAFLLDSSAWAAVDASPEDCELSVIFTELARRGSLFAADITGAFWYDIDTAEDLANANFLLARAGSS